jgi:hypothetical protein
MTNRAQRDIRDLMTDSPGLRLLVGVMVRDQTQRADWLAEHGEPPQVDIASLTFTEDQVLGDWFPDDRIGIA